MTAAGRRGVRSLQRSGPGHISHTPRELANINHGFQCFFSYVFVVLRGKKREIGEDLGGVEGMKQNMIKIKIYYVKSSKTKIKTSKT